MSEYAVYCFADQGYYCWQAVVTDAVLETQTFQRFPCGNKNFVAVNQTMERLSNTWLLLIRGNNKFVTFDYLEQNIILYLNFLVSDKRRPIHVPVSSVSTKELQSHCAYTWTYILEHILKPTCTHVQIFFLFLIHYFGSMYMYYFS